MAIRYLGDGNPDGTNFGRSDDKIGFFGNATPTVKKGTTSFALVAAATSSVATTATLEVVSNANRVAINAVTTELIAKGFIASA